MCKFVIGTFKKRTHLIVMTAIPLITAEEAAAFIHHGDTIGLSGFTPAGSPKVIIPALAERARREHEAGRPFQVRVVSGASTGVTCDEALCEQDAISFRIPYITNKLASHKANEGSMQFSDITLSAMATQIREGYIGQLDWAVVTACDLEVTNGMARIYPTAGVGISPTMCHYATQGVFVEINDLYFQKPKGLHDIYELERYPNRRPIPIEHVMDRAGKPYIEVPVDRIKGYLHMSVADAARPFAPPTPVTDRIGQNVADFLLDQMRQGLIPKNGMRLQSGVGSGANAVLHALGTSTEVPPFEIYTEVLQDAAVDMLMAGTVACASACSLTVSPEALKRVYDNKDFFSSRLVLRPSEISNSPEVIARLGVISMNTAVEADIYGHVNSTKISGTHIINGLGGSTDFSASSYLSIFTCGSTAKGGKISSIVPFCAHIDHTQHFVDAVITEYGVALLRNKSDAERARALVAVAHPDYRPILQDYLRLAEKYGGITHHCLSAAFALHDTYRRKGDMRLVDWAEYVKD